MNLLCRRAQTTRCAFSSIIKKDYDMKTIITATIALAIATGAAAAQSKPGAMKISECVQIYAALSQLDRHEKIIKDGANERTVTVPYKLGQARLQIARALTALKPVVDDVEKTRVGLVAEITGGKPVESDSPMLAKLNAEYQKVLDKPCGVTIPKIKTTDLNIDENPIPVGVLSALSTVLE